MRKLFLIWSTIILTACFCQSAQLAVDHQLTIINVSSEGQPTDLDTADESVRYEVTWLVYLTNKGDQAIRVLTKGSVSVYPDTAERMTFEFLAEERELNNGVMLKPTEYDYAPVLLDPGESAALPMQKFLCGASTRKLFSSKEYILKYRVDAALGKRFGVWSGELVQPAN